MIKIAREETQRDRDYFNNPNGYLTEEEMLKMVEEGKVDNYIKNHDLSKDKCPYELFIHRDEYKQCFMCVSCMKAAFSYYGYKEKESE